MATKQQHPSVRFQNGEITDFYTAMQVCIDQQKAEYQDLLEIARRSGNVTWQEKEEARYSIEIVTLATETATEIYERVVNAALKHAADEMRAKGDDPYLRSIADAVETGNYSSLAL